MVKARQELLSTHRPVLVYHQVTPDNAPTDPTGWAVPVSQFARQMRYLYDHGYRSLPLPELLRSTELDDTSHRKAFGLTFDDGYTDFLTHAYPVLQDYGFTATVFLVTDRVGQHNDWEGEARTPLLTWEQVKTLHKDGISFGSHTCTHQRLPRLPEGQARHELTVSKQCLDAELGEERRWLAYPYGESNAKIQVLAAEAGYAGACGVDRGANGPFNLWRRPCKAGDTLMTFAFKISNWSHRLKKLRRWTGHETVIGAWLRQVRRMYGR